MLGPSYFYDFPKAVILGLIRIHADDTTAFCIGENIDSACIKLEEILEEINSCCTKHKLTVHPRKTRTLIINIHKIIGPLSEMTNFCKYESMIVQLIIGEKLLLYS